MNDSDSRVLLTRHLCKEQVLEAIQTRKLLKFLIVENAGDDKRWKDLLMPLLCEYYSTINQYIKLLLEVLLSAPLDEESPGRIKIEPKYVEILKSQTSLMLLNDQDLIYKYGISLTVH